jgi:hypothetical protein
MKHEDEYIYGYNYVEIKEIKDITDNTIYNFKNELNVFSDITIKLVETMPNYHNALAFYSHGSAVHYLHPLIMLNYEELKKIDKKELSFAISTTILHELGHAMVDMDNAYLFKETNIFQFEDEEEFVENFAVDFPNYDPSFKEFETYAKRLIKGQKFDIYQHYE